MKLRYGEAELVVVYRRSPCGERGLKFPYGVSWMLSIGRSLPVRGAWVEIVLAQLLTYQPEVAPRAGSVG